MKFINRAATLPLSGIGLNGMPLFGIQWSGFGSLSLSWSYYINNPSSRLWQRRMTLSGF